MKLKDKTFLNFCSLFEETRNDFLSFLNLFGKKIFLIFLFEFISQLEKETFYLNVFETS